MPEVSVWHREAGEYFLAFHYRQPMQVFAFVAQNVKSDVWLQGEYRLAGGYVLPSSPGT